MLDQGLRFVLDQDVEGIDFRVNKITEHEIDDAEFPSEGDGRLAAVTSQGVEPLPLPSGHDKPQNLQPSIVHGNPPPTRFLFNLLHNSGGSNQGLLRCRPPLEPTLCLLWEPRPHPAGWKIVTHCSLCYLCLHAGKGRPPK